MEDLLVDHEAAPLLGTPSGAGDKRGPAAGSVPRYQLRRPEHIAMLTCLGVFLWVLSGTLAIVPATRMAEDIFCRRHYGRDEDIEERLCKLPEVQSPMAYLFGFVVMLDSLVGLLVAFPFGVLADRARKPVYVLGTLGQSLNVAWTLFILYAWRSVPVELILVGPVFMLLGGGLFVAISVLYAMLTDVLNAENRATWFFYFSLSAQTAGFIGMPISSKLMDIWSPWVPLTIVLFLGPLNALLMVFMPETLSPSRAASTEDETPAGTSEPKWWPAMKARFWRHVGLARGSLAMLNSRPVVLILVVHMVIIPIGTGLGQLFLQYFSQRFGWTLAETGYLLALRGVLVMAVMGVFLPGLSKYFTSGSSRVRLSAYRKDLVLAQWSSIALFLGILLLAGPTVGFVCIGLVVVTFAAGLGPLCRSLLANYIEKDQTSRVYSIISIMEIVGSLPAGPVLAWAFSTGMRLQGFWYGLPFLLIAICGLIGVVALFLLGRGAGDVKTIPTGDDEDDADTQSTHTLVDDPI